MILRAPILASRPPRARPPTPGAGGFTLLEIVLAVGVMGMSLVMVVGNIQHSVGMYRVARDTVLASSAARELLEKTVNRVEEVGLQKEKIRERTFEGKMKDTPWLAYRVDITPAKLADFDKIELTGLFRVEVTVSWHYKVPRQVQLVQYVGEDGEF